MSYKLICLDVDGTLLNDEKRIPQPVRESLRKAYDKGIQIALVTGRMPVATELVEQELSIPCIKACNAGTYILLGEECIHSRCLPLEAARRIYEEFMAPEHLPLWIFQGRKWYVTGVDYYVERESRIICHKPELADMEALIKGWKEQGTGPNKLLIAAEPEIICRIQDRMKVEGLSEVDMARSADIYLEIFPRGATKGEALEAICEKLDIRPQETMAFGDQELDIPMLKKAGTAIAMGNAIEELKKLADFVTESNNDSGIAFALDRYLSVSDRREHIHLLKDEE
ncbi:HAD family hydrolase [bacterium D16-54]|nr:HAD family hydrolase [bacterium D16-54]RKJ16568.1 HAD family hydrolase [bacterium D16-56]